MKRVPVVLTLALLISIALPLPAAVQTPAPVKVKPALLVIDIQNAYLPYMAEQDRKLGMEMINYVIALFRANDMPVIRVYHTDPAQGPKPGTEPFEFPKTVAIKDSDAMVTKSFPSAFKQTELDTILKEKGVNTLFLVGLSAVGCVNATYHGAQDHDYTVFMVKDSLLSHDAALTKSIQEINDTIGYEALRLVLRAAH